MTTHLRDSQTSPLVLPEQLQGASAAIKVVLGNGFEHLLGKLHVAVFELIVIVSAREISTQYLQAIITCRGMGSFETNREE